MKKLYSGFLLLLPFLSSLGQTTLTSTSSAVNAVATYTFSYTTTTAMTAGNVFYMQPPSGFAIAPHGFGGAASTDDFANYCDVYFNNVKVTAPYSTVFGIAGSWSNGIQLSRNASTPSGTQIRVVAKDIITNPATASNYTFNWMTADPQGNPINTFSSPLTINAALPVVYSSLKAEPKNGNVLLTWKTATEQMNSYFVIDHSTNGVQYSPIDSVASRGTIGSTYEYLCTGVSAGLHLYRIRQVDKDGRSTLSGVLPVTLSGKNALEVYPNPVRSDLTIYLGNDIPDRKKIAVFNISGIRVYQQTGITGNTHLVNTAAWPKATYIVTIEDEKGKLLMTRQIYKQ